MTLFYAFFHSLKSNQLVNRMSAHLKFFLNSLSLPDMNDSLRKLVKAASTLSQILSRCVAMFLKPVLHSYLVSTDLYTIGARPMYLFFRENRNLWIHAMLQFIPLTHTRTNNNKWVKRKMIECLVKWKFLT